METQKKSKAKLQAMKDIVKETTLYLHYEDLVLSMNKVLPKNIKI